MPDAVNAIEAELFATCPTSGDSRRRAIVMRDTDLRTVFASGRLGPPSSYDDFSPTLNTPEEWTLIPVEPDHTILVRDPKRACLLVLKQSLGIEDRVNERLPATAIESILFSNDAAASQWLARSTLNGLPSPLPASAEVFETTRFEAAALADGPRWTAARLSKVDEPDRVAGALVGALVLGGLSRKSWGRLCGLERPLKQDLVDLWSVEHQVESNAVSTVLSILSDPALGVSFDPMQMLEKLHIALGPHYLPADLGAWRTYVGGILSNREVAKQDGLRDEGKPLLRALELLLRTPEPSIARVAHEIRVRSSGQHSDVGLHVGQQALALAGWFQGFAATESIIKAEPGLYGIGCRVSSNSPRFPLKFEERTVRAGNYRRSHLLLEGGNRIAEYRDDPPHLLLKALHSTEEVCSNASWACSFDEDQHVICVKHSDWEIRAHLVEKEVLCWQCDFSVPKIPKQRTWPKGFTDWLLLGNARWRCSVGSIDGFPKLLIRHHVWLRTLDDEEVRFAINSILMTRDELLGWFARP
jgi:hypothetical protein